VSIRSLLLCVVLGMAGGTSVIAGPVDAAGWWTPFDNDLFDALRSTSPGAQVRDGEFGADVLWLHEPGATAPTRFLRDGLPLGTGHRWSDDPWLVSLAGTRIAHATTGGSGLRDAGGAVVLAAQPADTSGALVDARFFKGRDESYLRRLAFRTGLAPWVVRFDFDEQILYDLVGETYVGADAVDLSFPSPTGDNRDWGNRAGEAKNRLVRLALERRLDDGSRFDLSYVRARKHKTTLPALDLNRHEFWNERLHASWTGRAGDGWLRVGTALNGTDMVTEPRADVGLRTIETTQQTIVVVAEDVLPSWTLDTEVSTWRLADTGPLTGWWGQDLGGSRTGGQDLDAVLSRRWNRGRSVWTPRAGLGWTRRAQARPELGLAVDRGPWSLDFGMGGRAPRSDELATAWTVSAPGETYRLLPNDALTWERTARAELGWQGQVSGWTLQGDAVYRRLRDGIGWSFLEGRIEPDVELVGRWENGLEIDGWATSLRAKRRGLFGGRYQIDTRLAFRGHDIVSGADGPLPVSLPPEFSASATLRWQHAYFRGDGVVELGWTVEHRGAMSDPWIPGTATPLGSATLHHAMVVFRLTGADLGLDIRNILDQDVPLSAGALSRGREIRMRLEWALRQ